MIKNLLTDALDFCRLINALQWLHWNASQLNVFFSTCWSSWKNWSTPV